MGYKLYSNFTCPNPTEDAMENMEKVSITKKCTPYKTSHTLKKFELPDNKNIGNFFSKYELFLLDQTNFSTDLTQIFILQYPIPRAFLSPSPPLPDFTLAN